MTPSGGREWSCQILFYFVFKVKSSLLCIFRLMVYVNAPLLIKINYNLLLMTQSLKGKR